MNKKADTTLLVHLFSLIVVMAVILKIIRVAGGLADSTTVVKVNAVNDITMMINTLVGVPGEGYIEYNVNMSKFIIFVDDEFVTVSEVDDTILTKETRKIHLPVNHEVTGIVGEKDKVCLRKEIQREMKRIYIEEC